MAATQIRAWANGRMLSSATDPALSILDHGLTVGDGVFETVKAVDGTPFALTRHLHRLTRSAEGLGLPGPDHEAVRTGVAAVLEGETRPVTRVRITYTGGPSPLGSERGDGEPTLVVALAGEISWEPTTAIATVPWTRNERGALAGLKTTSYGENVVALAHAKARGASEAIFANTRGDLCEGTGSNICYVLDGELVTPTLDSGCLAGITRALVMEWVEVVERDAPISVLEDAEEIFLVSTTRDVQPVRRADDREVPAPGPITKAAMESFAIRQAENLDP